jgi:hypothetical protein
MKTTRFFYFSLMICIAQLTLISCGGDDKNDNLAPGKVVSNLAFSDADPNPHFIGGELTWELPSPETNISEYAVYIGESVTDRSLKLGKVPAGAKSFTVPAGTAWKPYLIVVAANPSGEASTAASLSVSDYFTEPEVITLNGAFVVNSGRVGSNNSRLDFINFDSQEIIPGAFLALNQRKLGDLAQDMIIYGTKMYILVSVSETIEVTDLFGVSVKQISTEGQPRAVAAAAGKVFATLANGKVIRLDTASLTIDKTVAVGRNPEQIVVAGDKLYVANSGGMDFDSPVGYDKTVSVIDIPGFTETRKIEVVQNPVNLAADSAGDVYVVSMGDYSHPPVLQRISAADNSVSTIEGVHPTEMTASPSRIWFFQYDWSGTIPTVYGIYDTLGEKLLEGSFINTASAGDAPLSPYKIFVDTDTENIFLTESDYINNGNVYAYSSAGSLIKKWETGLNPVKVAFVKATVTVKK